MACPELTVVITFKNEAEMLRDTLASLRATAGSGVDIHLINDASDDNYDYVALAQQFGCRYDEHTVSRGPAANRNQGADAATTPYVIFLDAHMRCYHNDWHLQVVNAIKFDPRALYCCVSRPLDIEAQPASGAEGHGAYLRLDDAPAERLLLAEWNTSPLTHTRYPMIPLPLGATYAFSVAFFQEIGGYVGLRQYGGEEAYAGMKAWLMGGRCRLISDVVIGHIYRSVELRPWQSAFSYYLYNKIVLAVTLFSEEQCQALMEKLSGLPDYRQAIATLRKEQGFVNNLRAYIQEHSQHDAEYFLDLNNAFIKARNLENYFAESGSEGQ